MCRLSMHSIKYQEAKNLNLQVHRNSHVIEAMLGETEPNQDQI